MIFVRFLVVTGRNIAGIFLILIGLVIWLTPIIGGSFLFLIPGIMLLQFPGKRRLFERLEQVPRIQRFLDKHKKVRHVWKSLYGAPEPEIDKKNSN